MQNTLRIRRPLRTAFVITSMPVGGAETLLIDLIRGLDRNRFAPELICLKEFGPLGEILADEVPARCNLIGHKYDVRVLSRLAQHFRRRRSDAVVTVGAGDKMFWGRLAAWSAGVPVIASALHSTGWPDSIGRLNRLLTPLTDVFIGVANRHARHLVENERFPGDKVRVIPNGVDVNRFRPRPDAFVRLRNSLQLPVDAPVCGVVAALRPEKNHALFLRVAAKVRSQVPNACFLIVGDGPQRDSLRNLATRLDLDNSVRFLGSRSDVPQLLGALDVFALTSDTEASPVSILEAMSTKLPVVATRVGSVEESVQTGVHGLLAEAGDADALASHVTRLLKDAKLRANLGAAGRAKVVKDGSLTRMVQGYQDLIEEIHTAKSILPDFRGLETAKWRGSAILSSALGRARLLPSRSGSTGALPSHNRAR